MGDVVLWEESWRWLLLAWKLMAEISWVVSYVVTMRSEGATLLEEAYDMGLVDVTVRVVSSFREILSLA